MVTSFKTLSRTAAGRFNNVNVVITLEN